MTQAQKLKLMIVCLGKSILIIQKVQIKGEAYVIYKHFPKQQRIIVTKAFYQKYIHTFMGSFNQINIKL